MLASQTRREKEDHLLTPITLEELMRAQLSDSFCTNVRARLNGGKRLPFRVDDGVLMRIVHHAQVLVPQSLTARVLHAAQYPKLVGHPGGRKMHAYLRRHFYWPSMSVTAYDTVRNCITCAKNRIKLRKHATPMKLFPASAPLDSVYIDILGDLIRTKSGHHFLLVITDRFSKLVRTIPLRNITADAVAQAFIRDWVFVYGPPIQLLSDNGRQFTSRLFTEISRVLGIRNSFTTTYHPQCNGQVERFNRTILAALRHYIDDHPKDWDLFTDALTFAYNTQPHRSTNLAPFELVLSRPPVPLSLKCKPAVEEIPTGSQFATKWRIWFEALMSTAQEDLRRTQQQYKKNFDERLRKATESLEPGGLVFLRKDYSNPRKGSRHKLAPLVTGPYEIISVSTHTVVIKIGDDYETSFEGQSRELTEETVPPYPRAAQYLNQQAFKTKRSPYLACLYLQRVSRTCP